MCREHRRRHKIVGRDTQKCAGHVSNGRAGAQRKATAFRNGSEPPRGRAEKPGDTPVTRAGSPDGCHGFRLSWMSTRKLSSIRVHRHHPSEGVVAVAATTTATPRDERRGRGRVGMAGGVARGVVAGGGGGEGRIRWKGRRWNGRMESGKVQKRLPWSSVVGARV